MPEHTAPPQETAKNTKQLGPTGHRIAETRLILDTAMSYVERAASPMLRIALGLVYVWFGALKVAGHSPVAELLSATLPWVDPTITLNVLGVIEVLLGIALLAGWRERLVLLVCIGHLAGTFLTFLTAPYLMMDHGNPILLTANGEFVVKNLVLISAALVLVSRRSPVSPPPTRRSS